MDATNPDSDQRLIGLLREGNLTALETLFARYSRAIYGFFYRTTGSVATGEDLTQDVFLRVLRFGRGRGPTDCHANPGTLGTSLHSAVGCGGAEEVLTVR